jgi:hypothetical protein
MKKLQLFLLLVFTISSLSYTEVFAQNAEFAAGLSLLQNSPNPFEEITSIKFDLTKGSYVKLTVVNLETGYQTILIDGEMSAGKQGIIFKTNRRINERSANFRCTLEIYSLADNTLLNTAEIKMVQK